MSLPYILLGMTAQPISGYDIKQEFEGSLRHFWHAELSQLYPALKKLVDSGLADVKTVSSDKGPDKKLYQRTEAGRTTLLNWLAGTPSYSPPKLAILGQVFFLSELNSKDQALEFFNDLLSRYQQIKQSLLAVEQRWQAEEPRYPDNLPDDQFYQQLTLDAGIRMMDTYIGWADHAIQRIKARTDEN